MPLTEADPVDVAKRLAAGELSDSVVSDAFRAYFRLMVASAAVVLADQSYMAAEVAHDALVDFLISGVASRLRNPASVVPYLRTAAKHAAFDLQRRTARIAQLAHTVELANYLDEVPQGESLASLLQRLTDKLRLLPQLDAEILRLRLVEGLTIAKAAERLGLSYSAAAQRYSRALRRLEAIRP